ncbi:MAG TPA: CotH kinase family protein, partial [Anaeromyxobacteraceae bacterium]|nr:CotH kinase family protein [Anaeromyxobacteraceae bacterium]
GGGANPGGGTDPGPPATAAWPPLQASVEALRLTFPPSTATIVLDPYNDAYAPGRLFLGGTWYDVELRQRGQGSRMHPKHSWKFRHPKGELHDGAAGTGAWPARTRHTLAEWMDGGYLADPLSYGLMLGAGVRAPRWRYVTLEVNGESQGVYVELQDVDKTFLRDHGFHEDSNVYRCGRGDCQFALWPRKPYMDPWEKETNESQDASDLEAFLRGLNRTPEHELEAWLERHLDLARFVRMYAVGIVLGWHAVDDSGSYLVHDPATDRWSFVPWDLNNGRIVFFRDQDPNAAPWVRNAIPFYTLYDPITLSWAEGKSQSYGTPVHPPYVVLFQRVWDLPALRNRILDEAVKLLDGPFSEAQAFPRIDALRGLVEPLLPRDPWISPEHQARAADWTKAYVTGRAAFIRERLEAERRRGEGGLVVNAIGPGFLELFNRDAAPRDLGGLALTNDLRERLKTPLPAGIVVAPHGTVRIPFDVTTAGGEVGLFDAATRLPLDVLFHAPLEGRAYARTPEGAETWGWR